MPEVGSSFPQKEERDNHDAQVEGLAQHWGEISRDCVHLGMCTAGRYKCLK